MIWEHSGAFWGVRKMFYADLGSFEDILGFSEAIWGCFGVFWGVRMISYVALE